MLALRPAAILADEPTSRLDPVTQRRVMAVIAVRQLLSLDKNSGSRERC
ncbi:hypothetical protein [Rubrimonas sp.]